MHKLKHICLLFLNAEHVSLKTLKTNQNYGFDSLGVWQIVCSWSKVSYFTVQSRYWSNKLHFYCIYMTKAWPPKAPEVYAFSHSMLGVTQTIIPGIWMQTHMQRQAAKPFFDIAQIGLKPMPKDASRRELSKSVSRIEKGALCAELRPFYCSIRILVPMSYMYFSLLGI